MVRSSIFLLLAILLTRFSQAEDETLKLLLAKSDIVVVATYKNEPIGFSSAMTDYSLALDVEEWLLGGPVEKRPFPVRLTRANNDRDLPKKGEQYIFFLKRAPQRNIPTYEVSDYWFGIQPYKKTLAAAVKQTVSQDKGAERWRIYREVSEKQTPENMRALMELADGRDEELVVASLRSLGRYGMDASPDLTQFLNRRMKDPNPKVALRAATTSCYSGDWSGFDQVVNFLDNENKELKEEAKKQILSMCLDEKTGRAKRGVPRAQARLRTETSPVIIRHLVEVLGVRVTPESLGIIKKFRNHTDLKVRWWVDIVEKNAEKKGIEAKEEPLKVERP